MIGLLVTFRKGGDSPMRFFAEVFYKKGLSRRHCGVCITFRLSAVRQRRFFCQAFLDKKAGFWLLFSKSNITY